MAPSIAQHEGQVDLVSNVLTFSDLPDEVLALVVSQGLREARDVASFAATNRRCLAVCRSAPLRLAVRTPAAATAQEEQAAARAAVQALSGAWPGTAELDLRGCPLEDQDVLAATRTLSSLAALHLSGCKKLTPAGCAALLCGTDKHPAAGSRLRTVLLQRCFQLTAAALSDVLSAAAAPGARLACAALSHLSLADWPEEPARDSPPPSLPAGQLRMLALHNCSKVGPEALATIAAACPKLEALMLGGCTFVAEEAPTGGDTVTGDTTATVTDGDSAPLSSSSSTAGSASSCPLDSPRFFNAALAAVLASTPALGAAGGGGYAAYIAQLAAQLAATSARLPRLRVLEVTFGLPGLTPSLQHMAAAEPLLLEGRPQPLQVWDLCTSASVCQALEWRRSAATCHGGAAAGAASPTPADAAALLSAAVNCSSPGRSTPLHAAAEEGDAGLVCALLGLGAAVDARDRSGATPLFAACEAGRDRSVGALLRVGARVEVRNAADESPLYISALKGHQRCVELLLDHCHAAGISWQSQQLYGHEGWTPLMAAAIGGRTAIVLKLLQAAGQEAPALVQQATRYGQNAVHLAARKAGTSLLRSLVDAGGAEPLLAADADGRLPSDIAKRNNNGCALRVLADAVGAGHAAALRRDQARLRGTQPTAERPRPNDHRQQHPAQRWVGRRLQQRKSGPGSTGQGSAGSH